MRSHAEVLDLNREIKEAEQRILDLEMQLECEGFSHSISDELGHVTDYYNSLIHFRNEDSNRTVTKIHDVLVRRELATV